MPDTSIEATPLEPAKNKAVEIFKKYCPEFDSEFYGDGQIFLKWKIAEKLVSERAFGTDLAPYATALLTAHLLWIDGANVDGKGQVNGSSDAPITSKAVGEVSLSTGTPAGLDASNSLSSSKWGRLYLSLAEIFGVGAVQL